MLTATVRRSLVRGVLGAMLVVLAGWSTVPDDPVELHVIGRHSSETVVEADTGP